MRVAVVVAVVVAWGREGRNRSNSLKRLCDCRVEMSIMCQTWVSGRHSRISGKPRERKKMCSGILRGESEALRTRPKKRKRQNAPSAADPCLCPMVLIPPARGGRSERTWYMVSNRVGETW